jgi:SagB-type dehydrogenase family enzyme
MNKRTRCFFMILVLVIIICPGVSFSQEIKTLVLPAPQMDGGKSLMQALQERRTARAFSNGVLSRQQLSNLLWAAFGINRPKAEKRTAPSALNQQEIDIYVATAEGLYLYDAAAHALKEILSEDIRALTGRQGYVASAAVNLIYVADFSRMGKLKDETDKTFYSAADTGFIGQNVYLFCASEGLVSVIRGSIDREALAKKMGLTLSQRITLAQCVGIEKEK